MILGMRTDKPESELYLIKDSEQIDSLVWQAHRKLAETLHAHIDKLLTNNKCLLDNLDGIVIYEGPGSFTGLRIGMSVANALGYSLSVPVQAMGGEAWLEEGVKSVLAGKTNTVALPKYGSTAHITKPKR